MDVSELWRTCEMTTIICRVIELLKGDSQYTREDAVGDLEEFLLKHVEPIFSSVFITEREPSENEYFAIEEERRLRELDELVVEREGGDEKQI